ncbi:unnamed protein product [Microthlaspi erraticum]|uniref:Retrotransposon gag domain-containing protein n=1 Tax=Microthlaspi erraticum TaxID=1685480 RepID=A0A6D2LPB0_9BRAS|nr:unnamed protein product [Microthlaspi erraticum]
MSDSDDQEERDNLAAREIALAEQHEDPRIRMPRTIAPMMNAEMERDTMKNAGGAPKEYLKCKLFSFTLTGKALRWVKSLPAQSITTWKEYKVAFLGHFFTKQRANLLREKISSFQQGPVEPFHEALERFKDYTRECPNHGLSDGSLWNIFYRGITSSDSDNFIGHERAVKAINSDPYRDGYSEIKAMMAEILRNQGREVERQREAYRVESTIIQDYFGDLIPSFQEEVNFVGIDGLTRGEEAWKGEHDVFTTKITQ